METYQLDGYKIKSRFIKKNRQYVLLENEYEKTKQMQYAHLVWLTINPAFEIIPKGYVIHHLDHNELNDDPSNLALMSKHSHTAHHFKSVNLPKIEVIFHDKNIVYTPDNADRIHIYPKGKRWYINWYDNGGRERIFSWHGKSFDSEEKAQAARDHLIKHGFINR